MTKTRWKIAATGGFVLREGEEKENPAENYKCCKCPPITQYDSVYGAKMAMSTLIEVIAANPFYHSSRPKCLKFLGEISDSGSINHGPLIKRVVDVSINEWTNAGNHRFGLKFLALDLNLYRFTRWAHADLMCSRLLTLGVVARCDARVN